MYMCDNQFHTEALRGLLEDDEKYGFIIMDGSGTLWGTLAGNARVVLKKISVDLPKKHGRGGQSAPRFARIRKEKRQNYITQVAELTTQIFITNNMPNVAGLILAGSADFKAQLAEANTFDPRLQNIILNIVDISYGGENGFAQVRTIPLQLSCRSIYWLMYCMCSSCVISYFATVTHTSLASEPFPHRPSTWLRTPSATSSSCARRPC